MSENEGFITLSRQVFIRGIPNFQTDLQDSLCKRSVGTGGEGLTCSENG
jgi:hypothetical protein